VNRYRVAESFEVSCRRIFRPRILPICSGVGTGLPTMWDLHVRRDWHFTTAVSSKYQSRLTHKFPLRGARVHKRGAGFRWLDLIS
jgi:hypothetical protein